MRDLKTYLSVAPVVSTLWFGALARIDEDKPYDSEGGVAFVTDPYPRSRSYAVAKRGPAFEIHSSRLVSVEARK